MPERDGLAVHRQGHRALELVLQLADVSGPVEAREPLERRGLDAGNALGMPLGRAGEAHIGKKRNVGTSLAERGDVYREGAHPEVEIIPESSPFHLRAQVAVGSGDEPHVDLPWAAVAHQRYLRTWPPDCGTASAAETVEPDLELEAAVLRLLDGFEGVFQAQLAGPYLLDLNPRVYGSLPLAVEAGANLPAVYCDLLRGVERDVVRARPGVFYRWIEGDLRHLFAGVRDGSLGLGAAVRALLPRRGAAHSTESLSDPLPAIARLRYAMRRSRPRGSATHG